MGPAKASTAARLDARKDAIVRQWEARVRALVPVARRETPADVVDHIPSLLNELVRALGGVPEGGQPDEHQAALRHAAHRAKMGGYQLEHVLEEYHLLQDVVIETLMAEDAVSFVDLRIILNMISAAIEDSVGHFVELQRAELERREEPFRLLLENVRDFAIFMTDKDNRITTWNVGVERLLGYPRDEFLGKTASLIFTPEDRAKKADERELATALREGRATDRRWHLRKDGSRFFADGVMTAIWDDAGELRGFAKVMRDVTDAKRLEEERQALYEEAERARTRAELAAAARDRILGVVSHDLRNPLGTIDLTLAVVERSPQARLEPRQLAIIKRSVQRMESLIRDLLDVAAIEAGKLSTKSELVDAVQLVRETADLQHVRAVENEIALEAAAPEELPHLEADRERILQVFDNLLGNALKFTPKGGRIVVGAEAAGDHIRFYVRDSGPGVEVDQLERLFDPYWQARPAGRGGAGLGLAIARGIVEAHGGRIWAESEPGRGTTVSFTLPVKSA